MPARYVKRPNACVSWPCLSPVFLTHGINRLDPLSGITKMTTDGSFDKMLNAATAEWDKAQAK
jgi:hypothetical protein